MMNYSSCGFSTNPHTPLRSSIMLIIEHPHVFHVHPHPSTYIRPYPRISAHGRAFSAHVRGFPHTSADFRTRPRISALARGFRARPRISAHARGFSCTPADSYACPRLSTPRLSAHIRSFPHHIHGLPRVCRRLTIIFHALSRTSAALSNNLRTSSAACKTCAHQVRLPQSNCARQVRLPIACARNMRLPKPIAHVRCVFQ